MTVTMRPVLVSLLVAALTTASPALAAAADHCQPLGRDDIGTIKYVCHGKDHIRYIVEGTFLHGKGYWAEMKLASQNEPFKVAWGRSDGSGEPFKTWAECDAKIQDHLKCDGLDCYPTQCTLHNIPVLSDYPEDEGERWNNDN